jgi:hypothetical protein
MTLFDITARRVARVLFVLTALGAGSGCVAVQPWERGKLASEVMAASPDPQELKLDGHVHEYREGSIGGAGVSGGGCGCN